MSIKVSALCDQHNEKPLAKARLFCYATIPALTAFLILLTLGTLQPASADSGPQHIAPGSNASSAIDAPAAPVTYTATLSGAAEVPGPGDADGSGSAQITVDAATGEVCYTLTFQNIAAPSAGHIHTGGDTESGGVLIGLFSAAADAAQGCVTGVPAADISAIVSNPAGFYVNIHNADFPAGAIRGQLAVGTTTLPPFATVTVAHFAPFADTIDGTSVTVRVDGSDVLTGFKFSDIVENLSLPAGPHLIEVLPTGSTTVAISASVIISGGVDYTVAAIGDVTNQPLELLAFVDDNTPSAVATNAKIRIAHLAPIAGTLADTAVNICTDAGIVIQSNVPYKVYTDPFLELPAGDYDLKVALAADGCTTAALDIPPVTLEAGGVYDIFAIGDGTNQPLRTATTSGLTIAADPTDLELGNEPREMDHHLFLPMMNIR